MSLTVRGVWSVGRARWAALVAVTLMWLSPGDAGIAQAQSKKVAEETVSGTLAAVEKKGKTAKITVKRDDGDDIELTLTPKMRLMIEGPGDRECLRPNTVVECEAVVSNSLFFSSSFRVHVGQGAPQVGAQRDPQVAEQYKLSALVTGVDETGLMLNLGPQGGGQKRLNYDNGVVSKVVVVTSDVNFLEEGMEVELTGLMRAGKLLPSSIKATRKEPFKVDDLFGNAKTATKGKATPKSAAAKKTKAGADGEAVGDADPFGVMSKKDGKTPKGGVKEPPLEAADPFSVGKKDGKAPPEKPKDAPTEAADPFGVGKKGEKKGAEKKP
jgi:hypothetical protein